MKIYRVYEPFHELNERGTYEYGYFSTLEKANERLAEVWKEKGYPDPNPEDKTDMSWYADNGWGWLGIGIQEITVDESI